MKKDKIYRALAVSIEARKNCIEKNNTEWQEKHEDNIDNTIDTAPSGSGFDNGTEIILEKCSRKQLVFSTAFHHMNENGYYTNWTEHTITIKPDLLFGFTIHVSGKNQNQIKEYIEDTFATWLESYEN